MTNKLELERHLSLIISCGLQTLKVGLFNFFPAPMVPACVVLICFFFFCFVLFFACLFVFVPIRGAKRKKLEISDPWEACTARGIFDSLAGNFSSLVNLALKF